MKRYFVQWNDPNNSVARKGAVEYNGKTVFDSFEEAKEAAENDRADEFEYNPKSEMTWIIMGLPTNHEEDDQ